MSRRMIQARHLTFKPDEPLGPHRTRLNQQAKAYLDEAKQSPFSNQIVTDLQNGVSFHQTVRRIVGDVIPWCHEDCLLIQRHVTLLETALRIYRNRRNHLP